MPSLERGIMQKFLVIGLGSMGKRRVRCLKSLGHEEIHGFDMREDRRAESEALGTKIISNVETFMKQEKPICIISVPPDRHLEYMNLCAQYGCHFFVEASVILDGMDELKAVIEKKQIVAAPSCTLLFHPAIQLIKSLVDEKKIGNVSNVIYHSGQYLPDWHPYEKVSDFYVSQKETGGCREIVPFELTWLCHLFGIPSKSIGIFGKTISIDGASEIDDTYNMCFKFPKGHLMSLVVDVVSRVATRRFLINGSEAQLRWNWEDDFIELIHLDGKNEKLGFKRSQSHAGYNPNIGEGMYIDEVRSFLEWTTGKKSYPTNLDYDIRILKTLLEVEATL
jgi:predicted dehydrogenase